MPISAIYRMPDSTGHGHDRFFDTKAEATQEAVAFGLKPEQVTKIIDVSAFVEALYYEMVQWRSVADTLLSSADTRNLSEPQRDFLYTRKDVLTGTKARPGSAPKKKSKSPKAT